MRAGVCERILKCCAHAHLYSVGDCATETTDDDGIVSLEGAQRATDDAVEGLRCRDANFNRCGMSCSASTFDAMMGGAGRGEMSPAEAMSRFFCNTVNALTKGAFEMHASLYAN